MYPLRKKGTRRKQQILKVLDYGAVLRKFCQNPPEPTSLRGELPIPQMGLPERPCCRLWFGGSSSGEVWSLRDVQSTEAWDFVQFCAMQSVIRGVIQNFHGCSNLFAVRYIPGASPALFTNAETFTSQTPLQTTFWQFLPMVVSHRRLENGKRRKARGFLTLFLCFWRASPALVSPPSGLQLLQKGFFLRSPSFHCSRNRDIIIEHGSVILVKC